MASLGFNLQDYGVYSPLTMSGYVICPKDKISRLRKVIDLPDFLKTDLISKASTKRTDFESDEEYAFIRNIVTKALGKSIDNAVAYNKLVPAPDSHIGDEEL